MSTSAQQGSAAGKYFRPRRLGHVNLVVGNVDRSMAFYKTVVGIEEAYVQPKVRAGFLSNGNTHHDIGMVESSGPLGLGRAPGLNHIAFELETEVDLVDGYRRALADQVAFTRSADHDIAHSVYGKDPDGNQYEIYADVIHDWRAARHGVVTKPKPNWKPGDTPPKAERNYHEKPEIRRVESATFHPRRTSHATFVTSGLDASIAYYTKVIGLEVLARGTAYALLGGALGERNITLCSAAPGQAAGMHHVGFEAWSDADLDASIARLRAAGSQPLLDLVHPLRRAVYVQDPDGILLQFHVDRGRPASEWSGLDPAIALLLA
jgi:catechol 2,3-dioxygenase